MIGAFALCHCSGWAIDAADADVTPLGLLALRVAVAIPPVLP